MYEIKRNRRVRRKTDYIIISHIRNLQQDMYIEPDILSNNSMYTWGIWQNYFMDFHKKRMLPCHYFIDKVDDDYAVFKGLNDFQPSYYLEDLASVSVLNREYMNSILILLGDDLSRFPMDERMIEHLVEKVISPLMREYKLDFTRIKYIDECLTENWKENIGYSTIKYRYTPANYYNFNLIKPYIDKHNKR